MCQKSVQFSKLMGRLYHTRLILKTFEFAYLPSTRKKLTLNHITELFYYVKTM